MGTNRKIEGKNRVNQKPKHKQFNLKKVWKICQVGGEQSEINQVANIFTGATPLKVILLYKWLNSLGYKW